jgi:hypothetical protein
MFHPNYLCNISQCFILSVIFFLISNEVLISLYSCLDSNHINCPTGGIFKFLYKKTAYPIIFIIHVLRLLNTLCINVFYNIIKFFKNIILHIKLKNSTWDYKLITYVDV